METCKHQSCNNVVINDTCSQLSTYVHTTCNLYPKNRI